MSQAKPSQDFMSKFASDALARLFTPDPDEIRSIARTARSEFYAQEYPMRWHDFVEEVVRYQNNLSPAELDWIMVWGRWS